MPDISSIGPDQLGPVHRAASGPASHRNGEIRQTPGEDRRSAPDSVELSPHARFLSALRRLPEIRADQVEQVRRAIADESYETDEKLEIAVRRVLDEIRE